MLPSTTDLTFLMGGKSLEFTVTFEVSQNVWADDLWLSCPAAALLLRPRAAWQLSPNRPDPFLFLNFLFPSIPPHNFFPLTICHVKRGDSPKSFVLDWYVSAPVKPRALCPTSPVPLWIPFTKPFTRSEGGLTDLFRVTHQRDPFWVSIPSPSDCQRS